MKRRDRRAQKTKAKRKPPQNRASRRLDAGKDDVEMVDPDKRPVQEDGQIEEDDQVQEDGQIQEDNQVQEDGQIQEDIQIQEDGEVQEDDQGQDDGQVQEQVQDDGQVLEGQLQEEEGGREHEEPPASDSNTKSTVALQTSRSRPMDNETLEELPPTLSTRENSPEVDNSRSAPEASTLSCVSFSP